MGSIAKKYNSGEFYDIYKTHLRDLSIDLVSNQGILTSDISRRFDRWQFLKKNNKIIKYALSIGGVLTGSRALRCYKYKGKFLLDRKVNDFDIMITENMMFKIADKFGYSYNLIDKVILIESDRWRSYSSYSSTPTRLLSNDINLIIFDELEESNLVDGVRISKFLNILSSKMSLGSSKHMEDISNIVTRINSIKLNE